MQITHSDVHEKIRDHESDDDDTKWTGKGKKNRKEKKKKKKEKKKKGKEKGLRKRKQKDGDVRWGDLVTRVLIRARMFAVALRCAKEKDRKVAFLETRKDRCITGAARPTSSTRYERLLFKVSSLVAALLYAPISTVMPFNK